MMTKTSFVVADEGSRAETSYIAICYVKCSKELFNNYNWVEFSTFFHCSYLFSSMSHLAELCKHAI